MSAENSIPLSNDIVFDLQENPFAEGIRRVNQRFGIVTDAGFQPLPDVLLFHQAELKLRSEDLNVLLNAMAHWYLPNRWPFPRPTTIAKRMGVSERSVQRSLSRMRKLGLIDRFKNTEGQTAYDLSPLVSALRPLAEKRLAIRRRRQGAVAA